MTVDEFRADLEAEIRNDALSFGHGTQATFAEKITSMMREADNSSALFSIYYTDGSEMMTKTLAERHFKLLETFVDAV